MKKIKNIVLLVLSLFLSSYAFSQSKVIKIVEAAAGLKKDTVNLKAELFILLTINRPDQVERVFLVDNTNPDDRDPLFYIIPMVEKEAEYQLCLNNTYFPIRQEYGSLLIKSNGDELNNVSSFLLYAQDKKGEFTEKRIVQIN